ncbi:ribonuclease III domain-containing protein [Cyathus striatus]|nr:ribonuclease III domain-containing protein [Cyathus striatus]
MVHKSAFPFIRDLRLDFIHRQVVQKIYDPTYEFNLPQLSEKMWDIVCGSDNEMERLEFVGDALMSAAVAEELYAAYKQMSPGFYTRTSSVLTANSTFAHLMHKAGFHNMENPVKPAGDAFETIIAAYQKEYGHDVFRSWLKEFFLPLIWVAGEAHQEYTCAGSTKISCPCR